jgi:transposase InsO family protein
MKFAWIDRHQGRWPTEAMCRVLGVSRSGYYAWRARPVSPRKQWRLRLVQEIHRVHRDSGCVYGSPRVHRQLQADGRRCNVKTVAKLMRENALFSRVKRRFRVRTTDSRHNHRVAANHLDRKFTQTQPNRAWVADLTYVPTKEGWLYLAVVLDLYSRRVVGYAMADHLRSSLAIDALTMALGRRKTTRDSLRGMLHHSDRGVQYACDPYATMLAAHGIRPSMSRTGDCYDNAVVESFFGTLKTELIHHERYATRAEAKESIAKYIEEFYNSRRLHSSLGYVSPVEFEKMTG